MFGYVTVNKEELKIKDYRRYRGYYCGLCRQLNRRFGLKGRIALSYDMTFLVILLNGLYERAVTEERHRCIVHPASRQLMLTNEFSAYAADMTVLFTYYKCEDDVRDEGSMSAKTYLRAIRPAAEKVQAQYPRQAAALSAGIAELTAVERAGIAELDRAAGIFGSMLAEIFNYREDEWSGDLKAIGFFLGKYIYLLDGYDDLEKDEKKHSYNPWMTEKSRADFDALVENTLTMMMAECAGAFEKLPIIQDAEILRNVIYSGVWMKYHEIRRRRDQKEET